MAKSYTNRVIAPEIVTKPVSNERVLHYEYHRGQKWTAFISTPHGRHDVERRVGLDKVIARAKQMGRRPVYVSA